MLLSLILVDTDQVSPVWSILGISKPLWRKLGAASLRQHRGRWDAGDLRTHEGPAAAGSDTGGLDAAGCWRQVWGRCRGHRSQARGAHRADKRAGSVRRLACWKLASTGARFAQRLLKLLRLWGSCWPNPEAGRGWLSGPGWEMREGCGGGLSTYSRLVVSCRRCWGEVRSHRADQGEVTEFSR